MYLNLQHNRTKSKKVSSAVLTIHITALFLRDYSSVVLFAPRPLVQEEGRVRGAGIKHNPILRKSDKEFHKFGRNLIYVITFLREANTS